MGSPTAPASSPRERRRFLAAALALGACFLALQLLRGAEPLALDQGLFACFGRFIPRGILPYRDLFDSKPPLLLYAYAAAFALPGAGATPLWLFEAAWLALTCVLAGRVAAGLAGKWAGLGAAALLFATLWSPALGGYWSRAQAEELLALPLLGAAALAQRARSAPRWAVWVGALGGAAALFKLAALPALLAFPLLWLGVRGAAARAGLLGAGLAAALGLAGAWFLAHGALGALWYSTVSYQQLWASVIAPPWLDVLTGFARTVGAAFPTSLLLAALGFAHLWRTQQDRGAWLLAWLLLGAAAVLAQRQLAGYHFLLLCPPLAIAAGVGAQALVLLLRGGGGRRALAGVLALAVAGGALRGAWTWVDAYGPNLRHLRGLEDRADFLARFDRGAFSPATEEAAAAWLSARGGPDAGLLVWGLSPGIYALSGRTPATRYPFHQFLLTRSALSRKFPGLPERRAELLAALSQRPPGHILVGTADANPFEPLDSQTELLQFPELSRFVDERYGLQTRVGRFLVYERR